MTLPLVLLPGMMCDARLFGPQIDAFSAARVVQVAPIGGHDSVAALAREVLLHAPPVFALLGLSMGGIVAMEVMRQAPQRVRGIALLDTNPLAETEQAKAKRALQIAMVNQGHLREVLQKDMKPNYLMPGPDKHRLLQLCMDMALALGPQVFEHQSVALRDRTDQSVTLMASHIPSLLMCGEHDQLCPLDRHQLMQQFMPHATLEVIDNAAHLPTLEQPLQTNAALLRWLQQF
jgi:pimeloyl-ACP methyl ester carboxylesterase